MRRSDVQTCPDRISMPGPWNVGENLDHWDTGRWSKNFLAIRLGHFITILANRIQNRGKQTLFLGPTNDEWHWKGTIPRTCSFCGGIHPEDAIRLVGDGWEVEKTDKSYKRYLEPPGYRAHIQKMMDRLHLRMLKHEEPEEFWSPVPPVKLYTAHFDADQADRFNAVMHTMEEKWRKRVNE